MALGELAGGPGAAVDDEMAKLFIEDARELIFPLFLVDGTDKTVNTDSGEFLGTAFFVTKKADAITAMHVVPDPKHLPPGKRLVAVVQHGDAPVVCWVTAALVFEQCDLALIHVNLEQTKYLEVNDDEVFPGTDVQILGIPKHEVWMSGKEMRLLKGHVTLASRYLELNIEMPRGMSGSPVFVGTKVAAFASRSISSEEVEEATEEIEQISNDKERIVITKVTRLTHYGLAVPLSNLRGQASPIFDGKPKSLFEFIAAKNC